MVPVSLQCTHLFIVFACHGLGFSLWLLGSRDTIIPRYAMSCDTSAFAHITPLSEMPPFLHIPHQPDTNPTDLRSSPSQPIPAQDLARKRYLTNVKIMSQCTLPFNSFTAFIALHLNDFLWLRFPH